MSASDITLVVDGEQIDVESVTIIADGAEQTIESDSSVRTVEQQR